MTESSMSIPGDSTGIVGCLLEHQHGHAYRKRNAYTTATMPPTRAVIARHRRP